MQVARAVRLLPLPAAIGLGTVLALACSDGGPASVDQSQGGPMFVVSKDPVDDFTDSKKKQCPGGYSPFNVDPNTSADANGNGVVCVKTTGPGPKK